jgi:hypothetical protein
MMSIKNFLCVAILFVGLQNQAQKKVLDYSVINPNKWVIQKSDTLDYAIGNYQGKSAFFLKRNFENYKSASLAYLKDLNFKNGTIELDIASPAGKNGFVGVAFHVKDSNHYETLYFRPGSSGTIYAIQYMPKKKAEFDWWDYEADKYQSTAILPLTDWFHVKVIVQGNSLKVYLNNQASPVMIRSDLDPELLSGSVGFWLGNCSSGAYKNLQIYQ